MVTCDPTEIECPTCGAWEGWACNGPRYGYHAAGYHRARERAARARCAEILNQRAKDSK